MAWIKMHGLAGKVYVPPEAAGERHKHNCPDCFHCQLCSDDRCRICRSDHLPSDTPPRAVHRPCTADTPKAKSDDFD
jgi:hypothetical protein